jgi:hypothetical protein
MGGVPYCDACDRHWTPTSMRPDGSCPSCGRVLDPPKSRLAPAAAADASDEQDGVPSAPWHFKVLLLALVLYLGWRGVQGVGWLAEHL